MKRWSAILCTALALASLFACSRAAPPDARCPELKGNEPWDDQLGAHTLSERGTLLRCAHAGTFTPDEVRRSLFFPRSLGPVTNGYELLVIQYVSEGQPLVARAMTALLYLPNAGASGVPIAAVDHATSGIGPGCGPSHVPLVTDPLAVPLVGRGWAVIAPDYAGMGVDNGMTSYFVGSSEAAATLDGVRALRQLHTRWFDAAQLGRELLVAGHSQGGHAALFTHQLFDPGVGVELRGSVAIAPGFGSARAWAALLQPRTRPVSGPEVFAAMSLWAQMGHDGSPAPDTWLTPAAQVALPRIFHDTCLPLAGVVVPWRFPTVGDIYQPAFLAAVSSCSFMGACPQFEPWASAFVAKQPGNFSSEAPSLVLQGLEDKIVPASTVACIVDRLRAHGTPVRACAYSGDDHMSILGSAVPATIRWMDARRRGENPDVCPAQLTVACDAQ